MIDLQTHFNNPRTKLNKRTYIVILDVPDEDHQQSLNVLIDTVNTVREIEKTEIQPTPTFGNHLHSEFITDVIHLNNHFITLLTLDQILDLETLDKPTTCDDN